MQGFVHFVLDIVISVSAEWWPCPDVVSFGVLSFSTGQPVPEQSKEALTHVQVEFSESYS